MASEEEYLQMKRIGNGFDDIYIDCKPVSIRGDIIEDDDAPSKSTAGLVLDDLNTHSIFDNIGFQSILGIALITTLYTLGQYIFRDIPQRMINKKIRYLQ